MARAVATLDPFTAIAEPRRRRVLESLAAGEMPVNDLVTQLKWPQPVISKHLSVLKDVGLVQMRQDGRRRLYRINGHAIKPVHDWVATFEQFWTHHLDRIKQRAERRAKEQTSQKGKPEKEKHHGTGN